VGHTYLCLGGSDASVLLFYILCQKAILVLCGSLGYGELEDVLRDVTDGVFDNG
jgi:hypothetical protein